jgi:hypothetical protein
MTVVKRGSCELLKKTITINEGNERLRLHNKYGWNFLDYLYTTIRAPKLDTWGNIIEKFKTLLENVQKLIIEKLHGGMKAWCIQQKILLIDIAQLTKYRIWLPVLVCLMTLIPIKNVATTYHIVKFHDRREFTKPNINDLVEKWIPCDLLWTPRFLGSEYAMKLGRNEKYCPEEIESKELWSTMIILNHIRNVEEIEN